METRSPAYVAVLAVIAGSILMVGSLMKPVELEPEPAALPTQADSARLQRIAQRRSLEDMAEYFAETASIWSIWNTSDKQGLCGTTRERSLRRIRQTLCRLHCRFAGCGERFTKWTRRRRHLNRRR